jgi:FkbM family methyltransferase
MAISPAKYRPDTIDEEIERDISRYFRHLHPASSDIWLDGGAHIGLFARRIAPAVKRVVCFEPEPDNFALLTYNTRELPNVLCHQAALVGNNDASRPLYLNSRMNTGNHSLVTKRNRLGITVPAMAFDTVMRRYGITHCKLNVEGAEDEILRNSQVLGRLQTLIVEWHFKILRDNDHARFYSTIDRLKDCFSRVQYPIPRKHWYVLITATKEA